MRHGWSGSQRRTVLNEPGISPEAAAALLGRQPCGGGGAAAAEGVKRSQTRQIVGLCRAPQLAAGMQQMGRRTNI